MSFLRDLILRDSILRDIVAGSGGAIAWLGAASCLVLPYVLVATLAPAREASVSARAQKLLAVTAAPDRSKLQLSFEDEPRSDWHYTPRRRSGIPWRDMNAAQRDATLALLRTALTDAGLEHMRAIMSLEIALKQIETFSRSRDPENYAMAIFGAPSESGFWGFRIEGHHLSLHFTLDGDRFVTTLPQFMGANPALVPRDFEPNGPRQGARVLGKPEDLARELMGELKGAARTKASFDQRPYGDIVSGNAAKQGPLDPVGVEWDDLGGAEQGSLLQLIVTFAEHLRPDLADARLARVRAGGMSTIRFGWAGSVTRGQPYYFRIQGATFLIEFDNSGGNHIHSVWRDFQGDFGRDVLAEHYARSGGPKHAH